jgi:hypothetical protein
MVDVYYLLCIIVYFAIQLKFSSLFSQIIQFEYLFEFSFNLVVQSLFNYYSIIVLLLYSILILEMYSRYFDTVTEPIKKNHHLCSRVNKQQVQVQNLPTFV